MMRRKYSRLCRMSLLIGTFAIVCRLLMVPVLSSHFSLNLNSVGNGGVPFPDQQPSSKRKLEKAKPPFAVSASVDPVRSSPKHRTARIVLYMSSGKLCKKSPVNTTTNVTDNDAGATNPNPFQCEFFNYGDTLMYQTAIQHCQRLGVSCQLSPASHWDPDVDTAHAPFLHQWQPDAAWFLLGFCFSDLFGHRVMNHTLPLLRFMKSNLSMHVALLPQAVGPFETPVSQQLARELFSLFDYIAVRDEKSAEAIHHAAAMQNSTLITKIHLIQDTVFGKELNPQSKPQSERILQQYLQQKQPLRPLIGLSLSRKMKLQKQSDSAFNETVFALVTQLTQNATVVLLPHEEGRTDSDIIMVQDYYARLKHLAEQPHSLLVANVSSVAVEVLEHVINAVDLLVVMRYHTQVVATRQGKVCLAFSWAPKYQALLNGAGITSDEGLLRFDEDPAMSVAKIWTLYDRRAEKELGIRQFATTSKFQVHTMYAALVGKVHDHAGLRYATTACGSFSTDQRELGMVVSGNRCHTSVTNISKTGLLQPSLMEQRTRQGPRVPRTGKDSHNLTLEAEYDRRRYVQHMAGEWLPKDQLSHDNVMAILLKYQHQVEKGLAMPNRRTQFGVKSGVFKRLRDYGKHYLERFGAEADFFLLEGVGAAIDQYIDFHDSRGESAAPIVMEIRELLLRHHVQWTTYDGGIISVTRKQMLDWSLRSDFASLVLARRSIRQYAPRLLDDSAELDQLRLDVLDAIRLASEGTPSVCNRQGQKVVMIRSQELITQAIKIQGGGLGHDDPEYLVMVLVNLQIFREERERNQAYVDGGLFAMSLMYGFQSKGLATCSLNFAATPAKDTAMRELMDIEDSHVIIMFIAVGRYREEDEVITTISPRRSSYDFGSIVQEVL